MERIGNISLTNSADKISKKKEELLSRAVELTETIISEVDAEVLFCGTNAPGSFFLVGGMNEFAELREIYKIRLWKVYCEDEFNDILKKAGWMCDMDNGRLYVVTNS